MIDRQCEVKTLTGILKRYPVVVITAARDIGKTTLKSE
jgi:hypothetical protein